ncbi:LysM peptidoglycan-binding domain-containing protein [uncultured Thiohalocapsa sp.]|uniref:LysM peptidoglycan-binding domain-containing protein n=1 Tax=uncultured Thiohalocapsa sp. TaxID=768990 RepID=UPI0026003582|nr:LysM peptidoglycan-binding domain-containing protein [uncultured Thiohalocapsa sp.]
MTPVQPAFACRPTTLPAAVRLRCPWLLVALLALCLGSVQSVSADTGAPGSSPAPADDPAPEYQRLLRENAMLTERLRALEGQQALAERLDAQATRLATLAERLEGRLAEVEVGGSAEVLLEDAARVQSLERQLAASEHARAEAQARVEALDARVAELEARLKQQQLTVDEALLRADKAEKLHAALEEAHARVRTENERLSLELATAKERQAEAVQRVLELDKRLETVTARAGMGAATPVSDAPAAGAQAGGAGAGAVDRRPDGRSLAASSAGSVSQTGAVGGSSQTGAGGGPVGRSGAGPGEGPGRDDGRSSGGTKAVYEVRAEDTLSRIAAKVYGDASAWRRIFEANRDVLDGPDELRLGMRLIIP